MCVWRKHSERALDLRALPVAQLFELLECGSHRRFGGVWIDIKEIDKLADYLLDRRLGCSAIAFPELFSQLLEYF